MDFDFEPWRSRERQGEKKKRLPKKERDIHDKSSLSNEIESTALLSSYRITLAVIRSEMDFLALAMYVPFSFAYY